MQSSSDIIATVVNGKGPQLAEVMEISTSRCYEILSTANPYPKAKRLIRAIHQVNPAGTALIRADIMALFDELMHDHPEVTLADTHRELTQAIQSELNNDPIAKQRQEYIEAIATASAKLRQLDLREFAHGAVEGRNGGRGK